MHRLYAFLAGLMRAFNCYEWLVKYFLTGLAAPMAITHKSRHDNVFSDLLQKALALARNPERD